MWRILKLAGERRVTLMKFSDFMDRFRTHQHFLLFLYVCKRKATSLAKDWAQILRDFMTVSKVVGFYEWPSV